MENTGPPIGQTALMVKRLQIRHHRAADAALQKLGLSLVQWDALRHLHENPEASLHDLAKLTFQTDQSMGTLATRMQARGLIERVPGPGRAVRHRLTAEGQRLRSQGASIVQERFEDSFAPLSVQELRTFDRLLRKVLGSDAPPPPA
ncbi:MAG: winged helix-turn-helix transcriptional regulator [Solirubrobacterales bacterium]|nr:winged helix-turn-helix transcriptional regulator [Solirubrobacterales bacterium]